MFPKYHLSQVKKNMRQILCGNNAHFHNKYATGTQTIIQHALFFGCDCRYHNKLALREKSFFLLIYDEIIYIPKNILLCSWSETLAYMLNKEQHLENCLTFVSEMQSRTVSVLQSTAVHNRVYFWRCWVNTKAQLCILEYNFGEVKWILRHICAF